jgi:hypothetical protein
LGSNQLEQRISSDSSSQILQKLLELHEDIIEGLPLSGEFGENVQSCDHLE